MKLNLVTGVLVLSSTLMMGQALAEDGTVHFRGEVTDSTCKVDPASADQYVDLHKVSTSGLTGQTERTTSPTPFDIKLTDCPAVFKNATVVFDGTEDQDAAGKGYLAIGSGGAPVNDGTHPSGDFTGDPLPVAAATGVAIKITNRSDRSVVGLFNPSLPADITGGSATLSFLAQYVSTKDTVTPGTGNADSQFTVTYSK